MALPLNLARQARVTPLCGRQEKFTRLLAGTSPPLAIPKAVRVYQEVSSNRLSERKRMLDNIASLPKNGPLPLKFLVAIVLAAAAVTGAALSGIGTGAARGQLQTAGVGQESEIRAEQRRQALALEKIELSVGRTRADIALLNARVEDSENLYLEAANSVQSTDGAFDLGALRTSFDEHAERNRDEFNSVNSRIDWLEKLVYSRDATGSIQTATPRRHQAPRSGPGWFVLHAEKGVAVIAGKGGAIDVTPGFVVPNLGRVAAIRQEGGRWVVVTDKGVTIRER
jgi:hypothetical protein